MKKARAINMKRTHITLALIALLTVTACGHALNNANYEQKEEIYNVLPPYEPPEKPDREKEITSVEVLNIPNEIPIGYFDDFDVKYRLNYSDGTKEEFPLKEELFPGSFRESVFGTVGVHNIALVFRGVKVNLTLNIVVSDRIYTVNFIDYDGTVLYTQQVPYDNYPRYQGRTPFRDNDSFYRYKWIGWDPEHPLITGDLDIHAVYSQTAKNNDMSPAMDKVSISDKYTCSSRYSWEDPNIFYVHSTYYVGTLRNVCLYDDVYMSHVQGTDTIVPYAIDGDSKLDDSTLKNHVVDAVNSAYSYEDSQIPSDIYVYDLSTINFVETTYEDGTIVSKYAVDIDDYELYTSTNNLLTYYHDAFADDRSGTMTVPSTFADGSYSVGLYFDLDVYITYNLRKNYDDAYSISLEACMVCPRLSYLGLHNAADTIDKTSSEDDHLFKGTVSDIIPTMKEKMENHQWN